MAVGEDITGKRFGRLVALSKAASYRAPNGKRMSNTMWNCVCDCGTEKTIRTRDLKAGNVVSCGCHKRELRTKHGHYKSKTYSSWYHMKTRCDNPNHVAREGYGGRGITYCDKWASFEGFLEDMGEVPDGMSLDRIDTNGNYEPGNCRWATPVQQMNNRRNTVYLEHDGRRMSLMDWSRETGLSRDKLDYRMKAGYSSSQILSKEKLSCRDTA